MRTITTKYLRATPTKGARIKAACKGIGQVIVPYNHALDGECNHRAAMRSLIAKCHLHLRSRSAADGRSVDRWCGIVENGRCTFTPSIYNGIYVDFPIIVQD